MLSYLKGRRDPTVSELKAVLGEKFKGIYDDHNDFVDNNPIGSMGLLKDDKDDVWHAMIKLADDQDDSDLLLYSCVNVKTYDDKVLGHEATAKRADPLQGVDGYDIIHDATIERHEVYCGNRFAPEKVIIRKRSNSLMRAIDFLRQYEA